MAIMWSDRLYGTGIKEIDDQHKELFRMVNGLMDAIRSGKARQEVDHAMAFLARYVVEHFQCEEAEMDKRRCATCPANKAEHQAFLKEFTEIKARYDAEGPTLAIAGYIQRRVADWLIEHISKTDIALRDVAEPVK